MSCKQNVINFKGCILVIILCPVLVIAEDEVTWLDSVFPPAFIHEGSARAKTKSKILRSL
ncbi:hypothetical protein GMMP1_540018 [Candidatus Magnetomoraceae bacterium gMMP-1]